MTDNSSPQGIAARRRVRWALIVDLALCLALSGFMMSQGVSHACKCGGNGWAMSLVSVAPADGAPETGDSAETGDTAATGEAARWLTEGWFARDDVESCYLSASVSGSLGCALVAP